MADTASGHGVPPQRREALLRQAGLGWLAFPLVGAGAVFYMRLWRGNRIAGLPEARRLYRQALSTGRPTIVCANHLTMIDSLFLHHGLASLGTYLRDFRRFSWNLPAVENFAVTPLRRAFIYLGKCIPIDRAGDAAHHESVLEQVRWLVAQGHVFMIFPEGGRSRTGRIEPEAITYGVGQILKDLDRPQVICAYLRGKRQETWGSVPRWGDTLCLQTELLEPTTTETGLRAVRDLARQVASKLKAMEDRHFSTILVEP